MDDRRDMDVVLKNMVALLLYRIKLHNDLIELLMMSAVLHAAIAYSYTVIWTATRRCGQKNGQHSWQLEMDLSYATN